MAWFVYIMECLNKSFYTGITWNLRKRILEHNQGKFKSYTKSKLPELVYWEEFNNRLEAAKREKVIKGFGRLKKQVLINSLH